jgi:hypothetical protein
LTGAHAPQPNPNKRPLTDPDPDFDWNYWTNLEDPRPPGPAPPKRLKLFGQVHEYQVEHDVQQPNPKGGPSTGADPNFDWNYWMNVEDPPPLGSASPKGFGQAHNYQVEHVQQHVQQPNPGPSTDSNFDWIRLDDKLRPRPASPPKEIDLARWGIPLSDDSSNPRLTTKPDSDHNLMAAHQPPAPYPPSSTEFDKDHDVNPPSPYAPSRTEVHPYSYPGSVAHPPSPGTGSLIEVKPEVVTPPSPGTGSLIEVKSEVMTPPSSNVGSPKEPENEVVHEPPPTPELTDPESLNADSQSVDIQAAIYAAKGKAKVSRRISGTARDVGNAAQRELLPAEMSLDPGE